MRSSSAMRNPSIVHLLSPFLLVALFFTLFSAFFACASGPRIRHKHEYVMSPGKEHHAGLATALLTPLDYTNRDGIRGLARANDRIADQIEAHLESKGIEVERIDAVAFKKVADAAYRRVLQERKSGASGVVSTEVGFGDLVPQILAELERSADLVIAANVVMRTAEYKGTRTIFWDGVTRRENVHDATMSGRGLPAASLYASVYTKTGEQVYAGYGGIEQIFQLDKTGRGYEERQDLFEDPRNIKEGVCIAFYPYFGMQEFCSR